MNFNPELHLCSLSGCPVPAPAAVEVAALASRKEIKLDDEHHKMGGGEDAATRTAAAFVWLDVVSPLAEQPLSEEENVMKDRNLLIGNSPLSSPQVLQISASKRPFLSQTKVTRGTSMKQPGASNAPPFPSVYNCFPWS